MTCFFFVNDTATTGIYPFLHPLSLHDALPISSPPISGSPLLGGSSVDVHGPCDDRITLYPAAPIRLAIILHAWTIARDGWDSSQGRPLGKAKPPGLYSGHTSDPLTRRSRKGTGTGHPVIRSEEHTSELQSLMRI